MSLSLNSSVIKKSNLILVVLHRSKIRFHKVEAITIYPVQLQNDDPLQRSPSWERLYLVHTRVFCRPLLVASLHGMRGRWEKGGMRVGACLHTCMNSCFLWWAEKIQLITAVDCLMPTPPTLYLVCFPLSKKACNLLSFRSFTCCYLNLAFL